MSKLLDLREFEPDQKLGDLELEYCPVCQKLGLHLYWETGLRHGYAHIVDEKNRRVIEGCIIDGQLGLA
jgi:hypothetical protein